jgi:hypothetical protein
MSELRYPNESREYRDAHDALLKEEQELVDKVKAVAARRRDLPHGCGLPLAEYLGAIAMVMVTGGWVAVASWSFRSAPSHILALLLLLWGVALAAAQVLPRIGYAAARLSWHC